MLLSAYVALSASFKTKITDENAEKVRRKKVFRYSKYNFFKGATFVVNFKPFFY